MAEKIKRFFECYVPVTACNLRCEYCYIIHDHRDTHKMPVFEYSKEVIAKALSAKRLGGTCYFSICGGGETLLPREMPEIVGAILSQGHFVNITTNGTCTQAFGRMFEEIPDECRDRLHFAFSLHYKELIRLGLLDQFSRNVRSVKAAGCSYVVQMNLYDGYLPYLEEIKKYCSKEFGAWPQVALTRKEESGACRLYSSKSPEEYKTIGADFDSPLFSFTYENFNVRRKEFCYAGDWANLLDLSTGDMTPCYSHGPCQNIFKAPLQPVRFRAIGRTCSCPYCINSSHFMALGVIPEKAGAVTYASLRNRVCAGWYEPRMLDFLNTKLVDSNNEYSSLGKLMIDAKNMILSFRHWFGRKLRSQR